MYYKYKHLYYILYKLYFDKDVLKQECKKKIQMWCHMSVTSALGKGRQADHVYSLSLI